MSDYYRDRCRHGGILSNNFIKFWWNRQILPNQYGRPGHLTHEIPKDIAGDGPGRASWGSKTLEGDMTEEELEEMRNDQTIDTVKWKFRDDEYFASKEYDMGDIEVPLLSVGNWGGILLHLRGNLEGYTHAGSPNKWLRMITGRHDLPFYYSEEVEIQRGFLDSFLKGDDREGWLSGAIPPVDLVLRKGDVGFNDPAAERAYPRRTENEWPIARTQYTNFYLTPDEQLTAAPYTGRYTKLTYDALGTMEEPQLIQFSTPPFESETEITGYVVAHLNVSLSADPRGPNPSDIDLFLTLRHISPEGKEVFYTGTAGDPVPLTKGWLRVSMRQVNDDNPKHRSYLPWRDYRACDVRPVIVGEVYAVDVEIWPTNVVVEKGGKLVLEVASGDTQGSGIFRHNDETDR
jgi:predicted acyl esterase